jgi:hypothetical protein
MKETGCVTPLSFAASFICMLEVSRVSITWPLGGDSARLYGCVAIALPLS